MYIYSLCLQPVVSKSFNTNTVRANWREIVKLTIVRKNFSISRKLAAFWGIESFWEEHFRQEIEIFLFFLGELILDTTMMV